MFSDEFQVKTIFFLLYKNGVFEEIFAYFYQKVVTALKNMQQEASVWSSVVYVFALQKKEGASKTRVSQVSQWWCRRTAAQQPRLS